MDTPQGEQTEARLAARLAQLEEDVAALRAERAARCACSPTWPSRPS